MTKDQDKQYDKDEQETLDLLEKHPWLKRGEWYTAKVGLFVWDWEKGKTGLVSNRMAPVGYPFRFDHIHEGGLVFTGWEEEYFTEFPIEYLDHHLNNTPLGENESNTDGSN